MGTEQHAKPGILHSDERHHPEIKPHTEPKAHPAPPKSPEKTTDEEQSPKAQPIKESSQPKEPSDMEIDLLSTQNPPKEIQAEEQTSPQKPLHHIAHPAQEEKTHTPQPQQKESTEEPKESEKVESGTLHEGEEIQGPDGTKFRIQKVNVKNTEASQVHCITCNRTIQKKSIKSHITTKTHKMHVI